MRPDFNGRLILKGFGFLFSVLPPLAATLLYFPLWNGMGGEATVSGFCVILMAFSFLPLWRNLRRKLASVSVWLLWLCLFVFFAATAKIAAQMTVITFTGFVGNLIGAVFFRAAEKSRDRNGERNGERSGERIGERNAERIGGRKSPDERSAADP